MFRTIASLVLVGALTGAPARAAGPVPLPPQAAVPTPRAPAPQRSAGPPEPLKLPGPAGCTLRAAKSYAGVTLEIAPGVPYAHVAQFGSLEVTLPIGRDAPAAGVSVGRGTSS